MRRIAAALLVLSLGAVAAARDAAFRDAWWDVRYDADPCTPRPRAGGASQLFAADVAGGVAVEVQVLEADEERRDAAAWMQVLLARWKGEGRRLASVAGPDADGVLLFTDAGLGGAPRRHAIRVRARGVHAFVAHAAGKPGDDPALRAALAGLAVGKRRGASLRAQGEARANGVPPDSAEATLAAVTAYLEDENPSPAVAAEILEAAVLAAPGGTYAPDDVWEACHMTGLAFLTRRHTAPAITWLGRARERAAATRQPEDSLAFALYNLACAHALAGQPDAAFACLDELVATGGWRRFAAHAQEDEDLRSLNADARWAKLPAPVPDEK